MSYQEQAEPSINLKPIIRYPHEAQCGQTYLMTIDIELTTPNAPWPYNEEEYPLFFQLETWPYFSCQPLGEQEPCIILHRFGGTYGPAQYLLTANTVAQNKGTFKLIFINAAGLTLTERELSCKVSEQVIATTQSEITIPQGKIITTQLNNIPTQQLVIANQSPQQQPEAAARNIIEKELIQAGWVIQPFNTIDTKKAQGIAIRDFPLDKGLFSSVDLFPSSELFPQADLLDYLLVVDGEAVGVVEVKRNSVTLSSIKDQLNYHQRGLVAGQTSTSITFIRSPLPFSYAATEFDIIFTNELEPETRSHHVSHFHQPGTLAECLKLAPIGMPNNLNDLLLSRLRRMPPLPRADLRQCQHEAIVALEGSLAANHPRALIQMATSTGKTYMAVSSIYRLLRYGNARRVLYLVDRIDLAMQALNEFQHYVIPDAGRMFTDFYSVQYLSDNHLNVSSQVYITTIQRLYTLLAGWQFSQDQDERTLFEGEGQDQEQVLRTVSYNPAIPIEYFDIIFIDECHRSIHSSWRPALEYFDTFLIGLTATPDNRAFTFFNNNLIYTYSMMDAVNDGLTVRYEIYRMPPLEITNLDFLLEQSEEILPRTPQDLNKALIDSGEIRAISIAYKEALFTKLFPNRTEVPKTVVFAQNSRQASLIVHSLREAFGKGDDFVVEITEHSSGVGSTKLINQFRNNYNPRIVVTVNMLLDVDVKSVEIIFIMRFVRSRSLLEQMVSVGCRTISEKELRSVTPDAHSKTKFVVFDALRVIEDTFTNEIPPVEMKQQLKILLDAIAEGEYGENLLNSLTSELKIIRKNITLDEDKTIRRITGYSIDNLVEQLENATDLEERFSAATQEIGIEDLDVQSIEAIGLRRMEEACEPFKSQTLRTILLRAQKRQVQQIIDDTSIDQVISSGIVKDQVTPPDGNIALVNSHFPPWLEEQQRTREIPFTDEQILWLERICDRFTTNLKFEEQDFNHSPFSFDGGLVAARLLFGKELPTILQVLNEVLGSDQRQETNSLPAILICGAPKSGKSSLVYNLSQELRKRKILHYVFRANPDGEGDWFFEADSDIVRQIYITGYRQWTDVFRQLVCRDLSHRLLPLIVDTGGLPNEKDNCIFRACTHSILLLKDGNAQATQTWHDFTTSNGLIPFAELRSQEQGHSELTAQKPVFTGTITIPKRGMRMYGPVFNGLVDRVAELFSTVSPAELERLHLDKAPTEYVVHLDQQLEALAPGTDEWTPDLLEPLLGKLPTQTALSVYGRGPNWIYGALSLHARTLPFYLFDPFLGWVEPSILQAGTMEQVPEEIIHIEPPKTSGDKFIITIHPIHNYLDYTQAGQLIFPEPPPEHGVIVSGPLLPPWLFTALARFYAAREVLWIALNDARWNQAFIIYSQVETHLIGDMLSM